jgi:ribosomal protein S18 acetylase RimI-like enzyme
MNIRKYKESDRAKLVDLLVEAFPNDPPHNEPNLVIDAKLKVDDLIFIAEDGNEIIGTTMAGYDGHRGWLYSVAVSKLRRREGIGGLLISTVTKHLSSIGCIKVNLQVRATNSEVVAFYKSIGFQVEERLSLGKRLD